MKELIDHIQTNLALLEPEFTKDLEESIEDFLSEEIETIFFEVSTYGITRFFPVQTWYRDSEDNDLDHLPQPSYQHIQKKVLDPAFIEPYENKGINTYFEAAKQVAEFIKKCWFKLKIDLTKEVIVIVHDKDYELIIQEKQEQEG